MAIEDHERAFPCGTMNSVIVGELCKRQPVAPVGLSMIYEDAKVLFDFLIYSFGLSIGLWVKGHGCI